MELGPTGVRLQRDIHKFVEYTENKQLLAGWMTHGVQGSELSPFGQEVSISERWTQLRTWWQAGITPPGLIISSSGKVHDVE